MPYSTVADLELGQIPLPDYVDIERKLQNVTDEIDSYIGQVYKTPVDISQSGTITRPGKLILKRISNSLLTGRLLLELSVTNEDTSINALGRRHIEEAQEAIAAIMSGELLLHGADKLFQDPARRPSGPFTTNVDSSSQVESFYKYFTPSANPYRQTL